MAPLLSFDHRLLIYYMNQQSKLMQSAGLIFLFVLYGCISKPNDYKVKEVPLIPTEAQKANLNDVFPEFSLVNIQVPDSVFFGNIEQIKSDSKRIYLLDPFQSKSITILDKEGNFINQLKKVGRGPGEYVSPYAFTIDTDKDVLILYDRGKLEFLKYQLPSLDFIESTQRNTLLMNFELLDNDNILAIRDDSKNKRELYGLEIWNNQFETINAEISEMQNAVIELSYHSTLGREGRKTLYAHPFTGLISRVESEGLTPLYDLAFDDWEVPQELYSLEEAVRFEEALTRDKYVLWIRFPIITEETLNYWYMYGSSIDDYHFMTHDLKNSNQINYSEITFPGTSLKIPMPLGIVDNSYATLVWPESIEIENIPNEYKEVFQMSLNNELPMLLYLK